MNGNVFTAFCHGNCVRYFLRTGTVLILCWPQLRFPWLSEQQGTTRCNPKSQRDGTMSAQATRPEKIAPRHES